MSGFQRTMNNDLPLGVAGDFASANPHFSMVAGEGQLKSGTDGVTVGLFAWADDKGIVSNKKVTGGVLGFVHRNNQAIVNQYGTEASMKIPKGREVTLMTGGDYLVVLAAGGKLGQFIVADVNTGEAKAVDAIDPEDKAVEATKYRVAKTVPSGLTKMSSSL
ncbi:structural cement protein Gp24 [Photorhabdus luminescens]|uniref:Uncharacterized protein n=1 Tax=Photorhabdus luminescens subsp. sonorensis TaxID=1173677 RepID=A0A5C4RI50_PHOLU|nr:hypothetical protein [Photorhabdus luminescens]TNH43756.1 hypothetical protein EP164_09405 [Photorhabdus luminescens subsp. sonorensis]